MRPTIPASAPGPGWTAPVLGRRGLLALGTGTAAALITGCTLNNPYNSTRTPAAKAVRDLEPDVALAVETVARLHTGSGAVGNAVAHSPELTDRLAGLTASYAAYLALVLKAVPDGVDTSPRNLSNDSLPTSRSMALDQARSETIRTRSALIGLALRAESGPFARLLGTMAAGLSQRLVVLAR